MSASLYSLLELVSIFLLFLSGLSLLQEDSMVTEILLEFHLIIRYQNNSAAISHVNRLRLSILADYLKEVPAQNILIEGHVCCGPDLRVSKKRARRVYKMLRKLGVPKEQMSYVGRSFDEPKVPKEKNETDKDLNRRVEIELIQK